MDDTKYKKEAKRLKNKLDEIRKERKKLEKEFTETELELIEVQKKIELLKNPESKHDLFM